ncbi:hypothetical protein PI124_g17775 [Phytophthora idaei]|nr:hypothetical protein PI124_g17775 [Phytophthora idaei]
MSDVDEAPKSKPAEDAQVDSDAVDYGESDDEDLKPPSGSDDEDSDDSSDSSVKRKNLPTIRPINHRKLQKERPRGAKEKPQTLSPHMDNTHVRLVKNLETSYDIFKYICETYEGASFHGDPYFIQHYLMEIKYEEGSDLAEFFLKLENAMQAASEATESKNDLRIWKGQRKYIPYADLKQSIEGKVRDIQAQECYTLSKGTPETSAIKNERALVTTGPPAQRSHDPHRGGVCTYCDRPRHNIRQCRGLQKDLRDGSVKAGTVLPANFAVKNTTTRDHPYRSSKNWKQGRNNGRGGNNHRDKNRGGSRDKHKHANRGEYCGREQGNNRPFESDDDADNESSHKVFRQGRRDVGLIAVATSVNPPVSLAAQANIQLDPTWTIDSGCTRHVTHESQWLKDIATSGGSITVGGNNQIPIEGIGRVELAVVDSKSNSKTLTLHGVLYAPLLQFNLLSVPAAVKQHYRFSFDRKQCVVQTDQCFKIKAMIASNTDLYQFQTQPAVTSTALVASGAKPFADSMILRL